MLIKLGENFNVTAADIQEIDSVLADSEIVERAQKFASQLKTIAPLAKDFLYFTAVMMHAAEAAILDKDGNFKKDHAGIDITASWENVGEGIKWVCSDRNIKPLKNANGDIFPESELIKAYKKWVGKPLCLDHKSSSVDFVRGIIVDTYYDRKHKRVIALCALDRLNYADLARKVATGYSTSVSMGTAVGKAVCTDCHTVARVESDFCDHMRRKSGYGEINLDLSPIELSIVVNGADPEAKIKHVIAKDLRNAADNLHEYMESKLIRGSVSSEEINAIAEDLKRLGERVSKLAEGSSLNGMKVDTKEELVSEATSKESNSLIESELSALRIKISNLEQDLTKLTNLHKDNIMTTDKKAYFQGGGGENEPTPGKPRYPEMTVDGKGFKTIRETEDKQMVGAGPFPGVGPVDGMYPGAGSESDESKKKRLQRLAALRENKLRRQAAIENQKKAYFQGAGGENEPTPGKPRYPEMKVDNKGYQDIRDKEDKQMVGQKPFPDVGSVTGLHPSPDSAEIKDELKRKEMLARAALNGKFVKFVDQNGKHDKGQSRWDIYAGKNLILTASVNDITGGNPDLLYSSIATKEFGSNILAKIKSEGFDSVKSSLVKKAQLAAEMTPAAGMGPSDSVPMPSGLDMPAETAGSSEDQVKELVQKVEENASSTADLASDLSEALSAMEGEVPELEDVKPAGEEAFADDSKTASVKDLQGMRKTLNKILSTEIKKAVAELKDSNGELELAKTAFKKSSSLNKAQKAQLVAITGKAIANAKSVVAKAVSVKGSFIKYAHGTESLLKRAASESKLTKVADNMLDSKDDGDPLKDFEGQDIRVPTAAPDHKSTDVKHDDLGKGHLEDAHQAADQIPLTHEENPANKGLLESHDRMQKLHNPMHEHTTTAPVNSPKVAPESKSNKPHQEKMTFDIEMADDMAAADDSVKVELPAGTDLKSLPAGAKAVTAGYDLSTKEGRAAHRMKLAQKGVEWNEMVGKAHPKGGVVPGNTGKASDGLGEVETVEELHEKMMKVVETDPKVKKKAEKLQALIVAGSLTEAEFPALVANGLDQNAVTYWKKFYGEAKDSASKDFANKLTQQHGATKTAADEESYKVRVKRAYELANEMCVKGVIDASQVTDQVESILKWNDEAFVDTQKMLSKQASVRKTAMPQVGLLHSQDLILPAASVGNGSAGSDENLVTSFSEMFKGRRY